MNIEKGVSIEINKVENGYFVIPPMNPIEPSPHSRMDQVYVFESFGRMMVWLAKHFEEETSD